MRNKGLLGLMIVCMMVLTLSTPSFALSQDPIMYSVDSISYGPGQDTLVVKGFFVNTSNKTVLSIADVQVVIFEGTTVVAEGVIDVASIKTISLGIGDSEPWEVVLKNPAKGLSLAKWHADTRVSYNLSNPQQIGSGKKVYYNGLKIDFDVKPAVIGGRLMIPARAVFEKMGCQVEWFDTSKSLKVTRDNREVIITISNPVMMVSGNPVKLDVPATIIDGRTLVPLRAIANALGAGVVYGEINEMAAIYE